MAELRDQVAIVTGAGSGIGAALAKKLSQEGAKVVLNARRRDRLEQAAKTCGGETLVVAQDVTDPKGRKALVDATLSAWGRIDILVNNAGLGFYGHFLDTAEDHWRRIFEVNLFAPVFLTQQVLPVMLETGPGHHPSDCIHCRTHLPFGQGLSLCGQQACPDRVFPGLEEGPDRAKHPGPCRVPSSHGHRAFFLVPRRLGCGL